MNYGLNPESTVYTLQNWCALFLSRMTAGGSIGMDIHPEQLCNFAVSVEHSVRSCMRMQC